MCGSAGGRGGKKQKSVAIVCSGIFVYHRLGGR